MLAGCVVLISSGVTIACATQLELSFIGLTLQMLAVLAEVRNNILRGYVVGHRVYNVRNVCDGLSNHAAARPSGAATGAR